MDDFIACIIPTTKQQVEHVARGILHGIHDIFPPSEDDGTDPISNKNSARARGPSKFPNASLASNSTV